MSLSSRYYNWSYSKANIDRYFNIKNYQMESFRLCAKYINTVCDDNQGWFGPNPRAIKTASSLVNEVEHLLDWAKALKLTTEWTWKQSEIYKDLIEENEMALSAETKSMKGQGQKDHPKKATHVGRIVGLIDLGHQPGWEFEGKQIKDAFKVRVTYELPNSKMTDGRPHWVSEDWNLNWFEGDGISSTLTKRVRAIDEQNESNDGKDLSKLINKPCMLAIEPGKNGYPKIKAVTAVPEGYPVPELVNQSFTFDMDSPDMNVYNTLPEFIRTRIQEALNYPTSELAKQIKAQEL